MADDQISSQQTDYTAELKHLSGFIPKLLKLSLAPNTRQREAIIVWPEAVKMAFPRIQKALEVHCWPSNRTPQRWVQDPVVEGGPKDGKLPGKWRLVRVQSDRKDVQGIAVILREGYATELKWDEAIHASLEWLQVSEKWANVMFPNIDPTAVKTILDGIPEKYEADFTLDGNTYSCTPASPWEVLKARPEAQDDGSIVLRMFLAKPDFTHVTWENYATPEQRKRTYVFNVPKRLASTVTDTYNKLLGTTGSANYSTQTGTVDLIFTKQQGDPFTVRSIQTMDGCQIEEFSDYFYGYTQAQVQALTLAVIYPSRPSGAGWFYAIESITYSGGGLFTVKATRQHALPVTKDSITIEDTANATTTLIYESGKGQTGHPIDKAASGTGFVETLRLALDRFCTWTIQRVRRTAKSYVLTFDVKSTSTGLITTHTIGINASGTFSCLDCPANGHQVGSFTPNEDGTYNYNLTAEADDSGMAQGDTVQFARVHKVWRSNTVTDEEGVTTVNYQYAYVTRLVTAKMCATMKEAIEWSGTTYGAGGQQPYDKLGYGKYLGFQSGEWTSSWHDE
jgi:hypothetical protein